jgi:hypothetical protein
MDTQTLNNILVAVVFAHTMHSLLEPVNIRAKVARLAAYIDKKPAKEIPININTRAKGIGLGYGIVLMLFLIGFSFASLIDPTTKTSILFAVVAMVIIELVNTVTIDAYHAEIEKVTKRFK